MEARECCRSGCVGCALSTPLGLNVWVWLELLPGSVGRVGGCANRLPAAQLRAKRTLLHCLPRRALNRKNPSHCGGTVLQVDCDFNAIFSTLLPNTSARLNPPEGGTFLDGLEVRVAFGGVWKESLTELSGGQRSLLALSLVLALCR